MIRKTPVPPPDDPRLGPYLFERRAPTTPGMLVGAAAATIGGIIVCVEIGALLAGAGTIGPVMTVIGGVLLSIGLWMIATTWKNQAVLRFHQRGVVRASRRSEERLPYEQVASVRYHAVRMHHNGMYTGTRLTMILRPVPELGCLPFRYSGKLKEKKKGFFSATYECTDELEPIHNAIAERLAGGMLDRLAAGETVPWTKTLALRDDGILISNQLLPWGRLKGVSVEQGKLVVKAEGKWLAAATAGSGEENFLPGWIALNELIQSLQRSDPGGVPSG